MYTHTHTDDKVEKKRREEEQRHHRETTLLGCETEPLASPRTTCTDAERKHVIRLRACLPEEAFAHAWSSSPCHTQRALFGRNCQRTGGLSDECAPETSLRPPPLASSSLCARREQPCSHDVGLFFPCSLSFSWTSSLLGRYTPYTMHLISCFPASLGNPYEHAQFVCLFVCARVPVRACAPHRLKEKSSL